MERTINYYLVETADYTQLDRVWFWCQFSGRDIPMYKTRITRGTTGWVVELDPRDKATSFFLINFGNLVTHISAPYYA